MRKGKDMDNFIQKLVRLDWSLEYHRNNYFYKTNHKDEKVIIDFFKESTGKLLSGIKNLANAFERDDRDMTKHSLDNIVRHTSEDLENMDISKMPSSLKSFCKEYRHILENVIMATKAEKDGDIDLFNKYLANVHVTLGTAHVLSTEYFNRQR